MTNGLSNVQQSKGSIMKTYISNKQLSQHGYENNLINRIDSNKKSNKGFKNEDEPFNTALADALREFFSKKQSQRGQVLPENRMSGWNTLHLDK